MTQREIEQQNLTAALRFGLIDWFQYLELWRKSYEKY